MIKVLWPEYIGIKDIAAALVFDYPDEQLPTLEDEEKWVEWAQIICNVGVFARAGVPPPFRVTEGRKEHTFASWQEWFKALYSVMSSEFDTPKNIII